MNQKMLLFVVLVVVGIGIACQPQPAEPAVLRLATTTSTDNSGLLDALLPDFEQRYQARVDVIAVGTGQALALGEAGDVDVLLVHARAREEAFVAEGHGTGRFDVMYNDFVLVGPPADPAGAATAPLAADALARIAAAQARFASRGDDSGTHTKERALWEAAGVNVAQADSWYQSLGQGMGDTLIFANETGSYTLTDRGTFLSMRDRLPQLVIIMGGATIADNPDSALYNPYGVIPVNPEKGRINGPLAANFTTWLTSAEVQAQIAAFGVEEVGQPLFYPVQP